MYLILDNRLQQVGVLDNDRPASCKFYDDVVVTQLADESGKVWSDNLTISASYGYHETDYIVAGNHILKQKRNGKYYIYRIIEVRETTAGQTFAKTATCENLLISDLNHTVLDNKNLINATSEQIFEYALQNSGWIISDNEFAGDTKSIDFTGRKEGREAFSEAVSLFNVEIDAYVEFSAGQITKCVDIKRKIGDNNGVRIEYEKNVVDMSRIENEESFYTALIVEGGTPSGKDSPITIASVNGGKDYIVNENANDQFNDGKEYRFGKVQNEKIFNASGLLTWGKEQLEKASRPLFNYEIDISLFNEDIQIGDTVRIINLDMSPALTVIARIISVTESEANPSENKVVAGEFVTVKSVKPSDVSALEALIFETQRDIEESKTYKIELAGANVIKSSQLETQIIARVFSGKDNITSSIAPANFVWSLFDKDGNHVESWEREWAGKGNVVTIPASLMAGASISCTVVDDVSEVMLVSAKEEDAILLAELGAGTGITNVMQCAGVDYERGHIYWTQASNYAGYTESFILTRTDLRGIYIDSVRCLEGGHGTTIGLEWSELESEMYIWTHWFTDAKHTANAIVRFKYVGTSTPALLTYEKTDYKLNTGTTYYRVTYDTKNNYVVLSDGGANLGISICNVSDVLKGKITPLYRCSGKEMGFNIATMTLQSTCAAFPYAYLSYGAGITGTDRNTVICYDMINKEVIYKLAFTFDKGTIVPTGSVAEMEGAFIYFDGNGVRNLSCNFGFGEPGKRVNRIYRIREKEVLVSE
ncbi:hypothetical protein A7B75_08535 [Listeria monocytogenes]|nr:hypothetical protein [Listeria monocytogenes]EAG0165466.1 hypothetical protein [Listeria monocytogenes]